MNIENKFEDIIEYTKKYNPISIFTYHSIYSKFIENDIIDIVVFINNIEIIPSKEYTYVKFEDLKLNDKNYRLVYYLPSYYQSKTLFNKYCFGVYEINVNMIKDVGVLLSGIDIRSQFEYQKITQKEYCEFYREIMYYINKTSKIKLNQTDDLEKAIFKAGFLFSLIETNEKKDLTLYSANEIEDQLSKMITLKKISINFIHLYKTGIDLHLKKILIESKYKLYFQSRCAQIITQDFIHLTNVNKEEIYQILKEGFNHKPFLTIIASLQI